MNKLILPLDDVLATLDNVGGKGASLARLTNAGLPVPGGFFITTAAYKQFVKENDLQTQILAALESADISKPHSLEAVSQVIRTIFTDAIVPQTIVLAITGAYGALPGPKPVVAVRSSATAEDLPDLSPMFLRLSRHAGLRCGQPVPSVTGFATRSTRRLSVYRWWCK